MVTPQLRARGVDCSVVCCLRIASEFITVTPRIGSVKGETLSILMNQAMVRSGCQDLDDIYLNTCEDIKRVHKQGDSCLLFRFSRLKHLIDDIFQVQNNEDISLVIKTTMSNSPI